MVVGFSSTEYPVTGGACHVMICVDIFNPPTGGALRPFNVAILGKVKKSLFISSTFNEYHQIQILIA